MDIRYFVERVEWLDDYIPLKKVNTLVNREMCEILYSIHTDNPIIKEAKKRQNGILDVDYSKVTIPAMVVELDITDASKKKLQTTLEKFCRSAGVLPYRALYALAMSLGCCQLTPSVAYDNLIFCVSLQLSHLLP